MIRFPSMTPILCLLVNAGCANSSTSGVGPADPPKPFTVISPVSVVPSGTVEERLKPAEELAAQGDHLKAIQKLEEAILIDDRNRKVRVLLIEYLLADYRKPLAGPSKEDPLYQHKQMSRARAYLAGLQAYHPDQTEEEKKLALEVLYEHARMEAKEMQIEGAFQSLRDAVGAGFRDFDRIRADPDWKVLLSRPPYQREFDRIVDERKAP
ncbi:MAG: hypothetical protein WKF75_07500 [Singulisphaera sp.]